MAVPNPNKPKHQPAKIQKQLRQLENSLADMDAYRMRVKLESMKWRSLQTYKDVVDLLELQVNKLQCAERDEKAGMIKEVSAMAYISAVQLQAIKFAKAEAAPAEQLSHRLQQENLELAMTPDEIRALSRATNISVQIKVLNDAAERPNMEQIHEAEVISQDLLGQTKEERKELPAILDNTIRNATYMAREDGQQMLDFAPPKIEMKEEEEDE